MTSDSNPPETLQVAVHTPELLGEAQALAAELGLPLLSEPIPSPRRETCHRMLLYLGPSGLCLQETGKKAPGPVIVDWGSGRSDHRRRQGGGSGQLVAKAVGLQKASRPLHILDATAGLGQDAFVLATLGCQVTLLERSPVMHALLRDGMARAMEDETLVPVLERMTLVHADARSWLADEVHRVDVIYLDPMFPEREKTALVKKEMRLSRSVVGDDEDAEQLLANALKANACRVVVKRPRKAPRIPGPEPATEVTGRSSRFDLYTHRALP